MIKGAHHVAISVTNLERSISFYTTLLGMEIAAPTFPLEGPLMEEVMALPAPKAPNYPVSDRGITHFGIEVTDIDGSYERLVAAGVRFYSPVRSSPRGVKATYGRDPDGNVFELLEMPQAAPV